MLLPVPLSPVSRTVASLAATCAASLGQLPGVRPEESETRRGGASRSRLRLERAIFDRSVCNSSARETTCRMCSALNGLGT